MAKRATPYTAAETSSQKQPFVTKVSNNPTGNPQREKVVCEIPTELNRNRAGGKLGKTKVMPVKTKKATASIDLGPIDFHLEVLFARNRHEGTFR